MKRGTTSAVLGILLLVVTGCGGTAASNDAAVSGAATSPTPLSSDSAEVTSASELEGVWHTDVVTPDDAMAALQAADLQQYAQGFFDFWDIGTENTFTLRIKNGRWNCYRSRDGGSSQDEDAGSYSVSGDTVTVLHSENQTDVFQWSIDGDTLTLTYVSNTFRPGQPVREDVYQTVLYMSAPWMRGSS